MPHTLEVIEPDRAAPVAAVRLRKMIFVTEKWYEGDPARGDFACVNIVLDSLAATGMATYSTLWVDQHYLTTGQKIDAILLEQCAAQRPDIVVVMFHIGKPYNPDASTYDALRRSGIPVVMYWYDIAHPFVHQAAEELSPYSHVNVTIGPENPHTAFPDKFARLWTPIDPRVYRDAGKVRDIDVSFVGNVTSYAERSTYLGFLKDNGINLVVAGGQRDNLLSQEDYVGMFQRSKMTINFSRRPIRDDIHELKSRVTEAMQCGTLLLESENASISQLYDPMVDYVPFTTPEDLLAKVKHYLAHEDEQRRIAKAGWEKTTERYNNVVFWNRIFQTLDRQVKADAPGLALLNQTARAVGEYRYDPSGDAASDALVQARFNLAKLWLTTPSEKLESQYLCELGRSHAELLKAHVELIPASDAEQSVRNDALAKLARGVSDPQTLRYLLVAMLYVPLYRCAGTIEFAALPVWFREIFVRLAMQSPQAWLEPGDPDAYTNFTHHWVAQLDRLTDAEWTDAKVQRMAIAFTQGSHFAALNVANPLAAQAISDRARIMERTLRSAGFELDHPFAPRAAKRPKPRIGFLCNFIGGDSESGASLKVLQALDRSRFEIHLFSLARSGHPIEQLAASLADRRDVLQGTTQEQARVIRQADLDILLIAGDLTAQSTSLTYLAVHRLARVQMGTCPGSMSSGFSSIDHLLSTANLTGPPAVSMNETALVGPGSRAAFGIAADATVFASAVKFTHITRELAGSWARIVEKTPDSRFVLCLLDLPPASSYAFEAVMKQVYTTFAQANVAADRLMVFEPSADPMELSRSLQLADVYLEPYPACGGGALAEALQLGLPAVAPGTAENAELIAPDPEAFEKLAVRLGMDRDYRREISRRITEATQRGTTALDPSVFAADLNRILEQRLTDELPRPASAFTASVQ